MSRLIYSYKNTCILKYKVLYSQNAAVKINNFLKVIQNT